MFQYMSVNYNHHSCTISPVSKEFDTQHNSASSTWLSEGQISKLDTAVLFPLSISFFFHQKNTVHVISSVSPSFRADTVDKEICESEKKKKEEQNQLMQPV